MRRFLATMFVALTVCCGTVDPQPPSPFGDQNGECPNGIKADGTCFQLTTDDGGEQADAGADAGRADASATEIGPTSKTLLRHAAQELTHPLTRSRAFATALEVRRAPGAEKLKQGGSEREPS